MAPGLKIRSCRRWKVAIILEATAGGTRKHVRELALGLDRSRFEVHLILSFVRGREMLADLAALRERARVHVLPMRREIRPLRDASSASGLLRLLKEIRPDVVHTHSAKGGFLGRFASRVAGIRHVVHTPHVWPFTWTGGPARALYRSLEKLAARWCERIVCIVPGQLREAEEAGIGPPEKLVLIENGVRPPKPFPEGLRRRARGALGVFPKELAVGMVARLAPQKGVRHFIEAASIAASGHPELRFVVIGSGPLEPKARALALGLGLGPGRMRFLGHREDVLELYAGLDIFALSSLYEGLPYVILEAMAASLPVVATRVAGTSEVIEHGRTGLLAEPESPDSIARAIVSLAADGEKRRDFGLAGRRAVEERFRSDRFISGHEKLYEELVSSRSSSRILP